MSAELTVNIEGKPPRVVPLGSIFSIGRGPGNDLVINDSRASRNHAVIRLQADKQYYVLDQGSSNGTLLNGRRITIPSALKSGDEIQIANHQLAFVDSAAQGGNAAEVNPEDMRDHFNPRRRYSQLHRAFQFDSGRGSFTNGREMVSRSHYGYRKE
jgi:pSer/pThr/pTyr-binding forkhead associated (FHA) protein